MCVFEAFRLLPNLFIAEQACLLNAVTTKRVYYCQPLQTLKSLGLNTTLMISRLSLLLL